MGKKKIEIKRIPNKTKRDVTFSKRRTGLFKKAAAACKLYDSEIAIIIFSRGGKPYSFGHSSVDSVIDRFLGNNNNNSRPLTRSIDKEETKDEEDDDQRRRKQKKDEDEVITIEEMVNRGGGGGGHGLSSSANLLYLRDGDGYSWPSQEDWNSIHFS